MRTNTFRTLRYQFGDYFINTFATLMIPLFRCLPPKTLVSISKLMGTMVFYLFNKYRKRVIQNLTIAFGGEKEAHVIERLAKDVFFHFTLTPLETVYAYVNPFERYLLKIKIKGKKNLDSALAQGKGVIALGAHLGPFTLLGGRLALEGYPFNLIINQDHFPKLMKRLDDYQKRLGQNPFSSKPVLSSIKKSINCLHRNEILYLIADEQQRRGGLPVPFFGRPAYTVPGPAILSLKTGAPILPMFLLREHGFPNTLEIRSPIEIERTSDEKRDIEILTAKFTKVIEEIVRQYPSQWTWLNRRWKSSYQIGTLDREKKGV